jgi:hypothetical protein
MICPICGEPRAVKHYTKDRKQLKTCGDPDCVAQLRGRIARAWYGTEAGKQWMVNRFTRYASRVNAEVRAVVQEIAGEAEMIPRWQALRIAARARKVGYHRGYIAAECKHNRSRRRLVA